MRDILWNYFALTGEVGVYLLYKRQDKYDPGDHEPLIKEMAQKSYFENAEEDSPPNR